MIFRRTVALVVAFIAAFFALPAADASPLDATTQSLLCVYASPDHDLPTNHTAPDRGPPAQQAEAGTAAGQRAADRASHGVLVRPDAPGTCGHTTYYSTAQLVQVGDAGSTTRQHVGAAVGDLSSLQRSHVAAKGADEAGALVKYDPMADSRTLLVQVGSGYAVTPGGRTISAHAAQRIALGGPGRPPTTLARVDDILSNPTATRYNPIRDTVRVSQGNDFVVVSGTGPQHIVTVMVR